MKKTQLDVTIMFTADVVFETVPELYFWHRLLTQLKRALCLAQQAETCQTCQRQSECLYAQVTGIDFAYPSGICNESLTVDRYFYQAGSELVLSYSILGEQYCYLLEFIELTLATFSSKRVPFLVKKVQQQVIVPSNEMTNYTLQTPWTKALTLEQQAWIYEHYFMMDMPDLNQVPRVEKGVRFQSGQFRWNAERYAIAGNFGTVTKPSSLQQLIGIDQCYWLGLGKLKQDGERACE